jgi:geranylgeranyl diphosphate synthase type II
VADAEQLESIHRRKTGRLLAAAPAMGARIAGADEQTISELREYGNCVGLAFQIADDLLDVSGDADVVGKGVGKDAAHGKATYPALLGVEESRRRARQLIDRACRHLEPLGHRAQRLESLAEFVIERDH